MRARLEKTFIGKQIILGIILELLAQRRDLAYNTHIVLAECYGISCTHSWYALI